ncbi:MAG: TIM barrel protein [Kiritimatiellae bacterium]|nr:TIM barrel protein [Kiritimatiellia bacterium]
MKIAFMSSVCPAMTLAELIAAGQKHGYEGIEFRPEWDQKHGVELDLSASERKDVAKRLADGGLEGCCLSPGVWFSKEEKAARDVELAKLLTFIDLAADTKIGRVRVFGDPLPNMGCRRRSANYEAQAEYLRKASEHAGEVGVKLVLETHTNLRGYDAGEIMYRAGYPAALWVNWHLEHCLIHGEGVDEAYRHVKGRVEHAHYNVEVEEHLPHLERQIELLRDDGFDGFFSVEVINPEDPEDVLTRHIDAWRKL